MALVSYNGEEIEFAHAAAQMDPDLRQTIEQEAGASSEQQLIDAYAAAHYAVFGEDFYVP